MSSWARVQWERKQVNKVLVRCKNQRHTAHKQRVQKRDERKLSDHV